MKDGKEIRWWCHGCLEDQTDDVFDHWNRLTGEALCDSCKAKPPHNDGPEHYCGECKPGGINPHDNRSDTNRDHDGDKLPSDTESNEIDVLG